MNTPVLQVVEEYLINWYEAPSAALPAEGVLDALARAGYVVVPSDRAQLSFEWRVDYHGGTLTYDDEAEALAMLQFMPGACVERREVRHGPWLAVSGGEPG